jgi:hypothetical protein
MNSFAIREEIRTPRATRRGRLAFQWTVAGFALLAGAVAARAAGPARQPAAFKPPPYDASTVSAAEEKLGIQVVALRLSHSGNLLDLRYRVVDPETAHACLGRDAKPHIEDPVNCLTLSVPSMPYVGALRQTAVAPQAGRVYFMLFGNAGTAVKAGSKVTLVIGGTRVENLIVE